MKENTAKKEIPVTRKVAKVTKAEKTEKVKKVAKLAAPAPVMEEKTAPAVETATVEKTDQAPTDAKLCPKCNGYYPGDTCPNCSAETDLPEPPKMKTVYGDIEGADDTEHFSHEAEAAANSTQEEALTFEEPLTGARLDTHNRPKEEPFEPLHLEFSRQVFIEAMKVAMDITEKRTIMPILSHVHLKSDAPNGEYTSCTLEATDLQITWVRRIHGKGDAVNRCIPGKLLMNEIKALPDGANVELTFSRHAVSVNGRCEILTPDAEEFPEIKIDASAEQPDAVLIENLSDGLKQVFPAISTDETRYVLTAVLIDPENGKVVATDGFRMHLSDIKGPGPRLLVPRDAVKLLTKYGNSNTVWLLDERTACFAVAGGVIATRLMDGNFPDYEGVFPKNLKTTITFNSAEFLKLLEGALAVEERVVLSLDDGHLGLQSENGVGTYDWKLAAEVKNYVGPKKKFRLVFNGKFLVEALKSYPAMLTTLGAPDGYGACLINEKAIVMPIRE
jgi:DNA polymerase-3 subunit beta